MTISTQQKLDHYVILLKAYNETTNIYAKSAYEKLPFHIADSEFLAAHLPSTARHVVDCGSGSGLPAIPIAILRPDLKITAIESKSRKTRFLLQAKQELDLTNLTIITGDVNEHLPRIQPDILTAKAFAPMDKLLHILKRTKLKKVTLFIPISQAQKASLQGTYPKLNVTFHQNDHHLICEYKHTI